METKANYLLVGSLVILTIISTFLFLIWLSGGPTKSHYTELMIYFPGSVSGLSIGSPVRYRGVDVGNVAKISLDPKTPDQVHVLVNILKTTPLHEGMEANLQMLGITGLAFIELSSTVDHMKPLVKKDGDPYPIIYGSESALAKMMENIPKLIQSYSDVAYSILDTLSPENRLALHETLQEVEKFSKSLSKTQQDMDAILANVNVIVGRMDEFSKTGFVDIHYFLNDARNAASNFSQLSESLRQDPSALIFQPDYEGHQLK
jgi:phospholipid/cholesterol/gamma-HCH transport system substrate-binding protein